MGWELSSWLALARSFQLMGSFGAVSLHGYLTIRVYTGKLGLTEPMVALELLICAVLGYSTIAIIFQRTKQRSKNTSWLGCFVFCDVLFCAITLGIITLLARAGLPVHCKGMTEEWFNSNNKSNELKGGYTTINFSDESPGEIGKLDKFCGFERSYFFIAMALVFTYILTIVLTVLRILEQRYTKNTKVSELLDSLDRAEDINFKILDIPSPRPRSPSLDQPPQHPPSEGVITRNTSLRSNFTAARSSTSSHAPSNSYRANFIPRRPINQPPPPVPQRAMPPNPPPPVGLGLGAGFVPLPLDEEDDDDAAAALVADGMQHRRQPSRDQHHPHQPFPRMPMLSEEDQTAGAALVSDGMRPEPMLPPYHPGSSRMMGHAGENNEMRLSEYVKGETRAQDMKDSGRY